ncbi:MAG: protein-L-isoaspartate O-methyltransferase [Gammaproteobacteria bacterium]|nr:protein-L-isoaspartate O-methyltransferase [Gammaproteobacteria bacterium]MCW8911463.1 protein-L-isoaspartate O-methyltransferase [Gammaproteobacteria bacterium]MCW9005276.1 protein-L-isoaspartate O-methyltransferase [Gammaproteobacteria bacterium]MCW9057228.1 protein-L-isoaspartate O-methyltransferase [Gammaproteobacteria bacterium]
MSTVNLDQAHYNMIEQQVRPWDVLDEKILETLKQINREAFVPEAYKKLAYADTAIPLGNGQHMLHPILEGRILQSLAIQPMDTILEVGTGSGFLTACLAHLGYTVTSIEIDEQLSQSAANRLQKSDLLNVHLLTGDAMKVLDKSKQYDVIVITASVKEVPEIFKQALAIDGRMFVVTGEEPVMSARLITRIAGDQWSDRILFETSIKPLVNAEPEKLFVF